MKILVINAGSSSLKYQLVRYVRRRDGSGKKETVNGLGWTAVYLRTRRRMDVRKKVSKFGCADHTAAFMQVKEALWWTRKVGVIQDLSRSYGRRPPHRAGRFDVQPVGAG